MTASSIAVSGGDDGCGGDRLDRELGPPGVPTAEQRRRLEAELLECRATRALVASLLQVQ